MCYAELSDPSVRKNPSTSADGRDGENTGGHKCTAESSVKTIRVRAVFAEALLEMAVRW